MAAIVPLVLGQTNRRTVNADEATEAELSKRPTILACPQCRSSRATVLDCRPPKAECADCQTVYRIRTVKPLGSEAFNEEPHPPPKKTRTRDEIIPAPPIRDRDVGVLTDFVNRALAAGPEGLHDSYRKATQFARRFGLTYLDTQWFIATPWLLDWAQGNVPFETIGNGRALQGNTRAAPAFPRNGNKSTQRDSRLRVRAAVSWRARWLAAYAMTGSKGLACRKAKVTENTVTYHLRRDSDFKTQADVAHEHFVDLLHTRCAQRALEGDIEPVHWQGVVVDHIRKFDSRLQIEMLRAHMPNKFKTPGTGGVNIDTGDKILVMTEELRAKLMAIHRAEIMDMPTTQEGEEERPRREAQGQ